MLAGRRTTVVALACAVALSAAVGGAVAASGTSNTITACAAKKTRTLRLPGGTTCKTGEKKITFNKQGVAGAPGAPGAPGASGSTGAAGVPGTNGSAGATGPQGPGATAIDFNSTAFNQTAFTSLASVGGYTFYARCVGSPGAAELGYSGPGGRIGADEMDTNYNASGVAIANTTNALSGDLPSSQTPAHLLDATIPGGLVVKRVIGLTVRIKNGNPGGGIVTLDVTLAAEPGNASHLCTVTGTATPAS